MKLFETGGNMGAAPLFSHLFCIFVLDEPALVIHFPKEESGASPEYRRLPCQQQMLPSTRENYPSLDMGDMPLWSKRFLPAFIGGIRVRPIQARLALHNHHPQNHWPGRCLSQAHLVETISPTCATMISPVLSGPDSSGHPVLLASCRRRPSRPFP